MVWRFNHAFRAGHTANLTTILFVLLLTGFIFGCSGVNPPVFPDTTPQSGLQADTSSEDIELDGRHLWGYYEFRINADRTEAEVVPIRNIQLHLNALGLLQSFGPAPVSIPEMSVNPDGSFYVSVQLTHTLALAPQYTAFDVRGICMLPSQHEWPEIGVTTPGYMAPSEDGSEPGEIAVLNAQGYTRRWNPTEYINALSPFNYIDGDLVADGSGLLCTSLVNPYMNFYTNANRHLFESGFSTIQDYHMNFPPGSVVFAYAVDASWKPHIVDDIYNTNFDDDDLKKSQWVKRNHLGGNTNFWNCHYFGEGLPDDAPGQVNVRRENCSTYPGEDMGAVLISPSFDIPNDPSNMFMFLKHQIEFDEGNVISGVPMDVCTVLVGPDDDLTKTIQVFDADHAYDFNNDPIIHKNWWGVNYTSTGMDKFPLGDALAALGTEQFRIHFVFYSYDGDDGLEGNDEIGWTLEKLRIVDENRPPTSIPDSFPPSANSLEPYDIQLVSTTGELQCALDEYAGGSVNLSVSVSDWQNGAYTQFSNVTVEAPDLFDGVVHPYSGSGNQSHYFYEVTIPNTKITSPGTFPVMFAVKTNDADETFLNAPVTAYQVFTVDVVETMPPFCYGNTSIHNTFAGTFNLNGAQPALQADACFLPAYVGGQGGLLFDGGLTGGTQYLQIASIDADGGDVTTTNLISRSGLDAGNAMLIQPNDYNGHLLVVNDDDPDNLLVYEATGNLLKEYDLGYGEDSINEPVALTVNPDNGDIWLVGDKGSQGIHLERWAFLMEGPTFEYSFDPDASVDLGELLGLDPQPFGMLINGYYDCLILFHGRFYGSMEYFDLTTYPPTHVPEFSSTNLFGQALDITTLPGHRTNIGADFVFDRTDGEQSARCRLLAFANTSSASSILIKVDLWGQKSTFNPMGAAFSCMALNNLPDVNSRSLVFFPLAGGNTYSLFLPPAGW